MDNIQKIKLLNELMSKATPQNVDLPRTMAIIV